MTIVRTNPSGWSTTTGYTTYSPLTTCIDINNGTTNENVSFGAVVAARVSKTTAISGGVWAKFTNATGIVFMSCDDSPFNAGWTFESFDDGRILFDQHDNLTPECRRTVDAASPSDNMNDGAWHLYSWSKDTSNHPNGITLYIDGVNINADTSTSGTGISGSTANVADLVVGGWDTGAGPNPAHFVGKECHSFLFNVELTDDDHATIYGAGAPQDLSILSYDGATTFTSNCVHHCALGDGDAVGAGNMLDLSPLGNDGTYTNGDSGDFIADVPVATGPPSVTTYDQLFPYELNLLDTNIARAVDGGAGGHYVPSSKLRIGGSGVELAGQLKLKGRESTHFLDITNGQPDTNVGRVYTWEDNAWVQQEASLSLHTLVFDLDLPDGCTLKTLTAYLIGAAGHGSSPAVDELLPRISLMHPGSTGALALAITSIDTTTTAAEYEVAHSITLTANTVIDRQTKQARLLFIGENNNFVTGLRLTALSATITQPYKSEW